MLLDVATFRKRAEYELDSLVDDLRDHTGRSTAEESRAWRNSLPALAKVLGSRTLDGFHLQLGNPGGIAVEYRLPASPSWADAILLGAGSSGPAAVVVELKDWDIGGDTAGDGEAIVDRPFGRCLHPSAQVEGYVDYCSKFHSAVQDLGASVHGCVYFTYASRPGVYEDGRYRALVDRFPVFARNAEDVEGRFPQFIADRLSMPDRRFAEAFDAGVYRQDRGFVRQISAAIQDRQKSPFVLLDQQRVGFEVCMAAVRRQLRPAQARARPHGDKSVVVIHGPPGSGKSVIAAHLWASIGANDRIDGNVVLTTTSGSQRSNWEALFQAAGTGRAARHVVLPANQYNPGMNQQWIAAERGAGHEVTIESWRANLTRFAAAGLRSRSADNSIAVSIVDEAHSLIDPTFPGRNGMSASGWLLHAGPQAWHVIRTSRVSVFLLDPEQSYRDNETTTVAKIREFADEFGADYTSVSLADCQFRCGGSTEYLQWLDIVALARTASTSLSNHAHSLHWRDRSGGPLTFEIADTPFELDAALRKRHADGRSCRIVASYARPWRTKDAANPHSVPEFGRDFVLQSSQAGRPASWSRIWNFAPDQDYSLFIQAPHGSAMHRDPLCEVGCPYVVRGFDFDYVGLLWLSDLVWRRDRWEVNLDQVHESAWRLTLSRARRGDDAARKEVIDRLLRGYRILLSRAMKGTYIWFEDDETRDRLASLLRHGRHSI
jgi:hypothetical protein